MITKKHRTYRGGQHGLQKARRVAVDYGNQLLYVITTLRSDGVYSIVKLDYDDTDLTILYRDPNLKEPTGLDVFNDTVIWAFQNGPSYIYSCKPSPTCNHDNMQLLYEEKEVRT